jgi:hypothetical protein
MNWVLKRTTHGFSAGTRCIVADVRDGSVSVEVLVESDQYEDMVFDANPDDIVKLRNRVDEVPIKSRYQRRSELNKHNLINGVHSPRQTVAGN